MQICVGAPRSIPNTGADLAQRMGARSTPDLCSLIKEAEEELRAARDCGQMGARQESKQSPETDFIYRTTASAVG